MDELDLIAKFRSSVTGDETAAETRARAALWEAISKDGPASPTLQDPRIRIRRVPRLVLAASIALVLLGVPAFGLAPRVASWINSWKGPEAPVPTTPDVVIATGVSGASWKIVATETDQGLCMFVVFEADGDRTGSGGCGWGTDIYGYPSATPHGYGSDGDELHWVEGGNGGGSSAGLNRHIVTGVAAENVASVDLVLADGRTMHANVAERPDGIDAPLNFWWAVLPAEVAGVDLTTNVDLPGPSDDISPVHAFIARDSTGTVLERRIVDQPNG